MRARLWSCTSCTVQKHGSTSDGSKDPWELSLNAPGSSGLEVNRFPGMLSSSIDSRRRREREMRELLAGQVWQPGAHREEIRSVLSAITDMMALSP
ncbi:hypothetical protein Pnap_4697 (plasmid) [Polaromonas naphthalenivorans CJ2]|uniref:Uncharacterized protein n=1 Tax=Polaromonas naphthalenivorans (strain CJ2) TaxID=365044 RepID=A1VWT4_POLNA|nr:hypothetical protein Pnap_4697 [Polaromonas naphthalenivorans CJ2]